MFLTGDVGRRMGRIRMGIVAELASQRARIVPAI